ncbi:MAG: FAD binding domain-containing protein [Anaerolineae bacterium]|nr:FAD binding domain-containing protein [Anaerolineae bacterium]
MPVLYNLREYHRPDDLDEAVRLLQRKEIRTIPLAGGIGVVGEGSSEIEAVVDLSALSLDFIEYENNTLFLGAMVRIEALVEELGYLADDLLAETARHVAGLNVRNVATLGGLLASGNIHSPLSVALAAMKARVKLYGQAGEMLFWSDLAGEVCLNGLRGRLITTITIKLPDGLIGAGYRQVARTPADQPIVCAASIAYHTAEGMIETSTCIGGLLGNRLIVIEHTFDHDNLAAAAETPFGPIVPERTAEALYLSDFLGSAEYRRHIAPILAQRARNLALSKL